MTYKSSRRALEAASKYVDAVDRDRVLTPSGRGLAGNAFLDGWAEARYQFVTGFVMGAFLMLLIVAGAALAVRGWGV
jgi:hypothetical protein